MDAPDPGHESDEFLLVNDDLFAVSQAASPPSETTDSKPPQPPLAPKRFAVPRALPFTLASPDLSRHTTDFRHSYPAPEAEFPPPPPPHPVGRSLTHSLPGSSDIHRQLTLRLAEIARSATVQLPSGSASPPVPKGPAGRDEGVAGLARLTGDEPEDLMSTVSTSPALSSRSTSSLGLFSPPMQPPLLPPSPHRMQVTSEDDMAVAAAAAEGEDAEESLIETDYDHREDPSDIEDLTSPFPHTARGPADPCISTSQLPRLSASGATQAAAWLDPKRASESLSSPTTAATPAPLRVLVVGKPPFPIDWHHPLLIKLRRAWSQLPVANPSHGTRGPAVDASVSPSELAGLSLSETVWVHVDHSASPIPGTPAVVPAVGPARVGLLDLTDPEEEGSTPPSSTMGAPAARHLLAYLQRQTQAYLRRPETTARLENTADAAAVVEPVFNLAIYFAHPATLARATVEIEILAQYLPVLPVVATDGTPGVQRSVSYAFFFNDLAQRVIDWRSEAGAESPAGLRELVPRVNQLLALTDESLRATVVNEAKNHDYHRHRHHRPEKGCASATPRVTLVGLVVKLFSFLLYVALALAAVSWLITAVELVDPEEPMESVALTATDAVPSGASATALDPGESYRADAPPYSDLCPQRSVLQPVLTGGTRAPGVHGGGDQANLQTYPFVLHLRDHTGSDRLFVLNTSAPAACAAFDPYVITHLAPATPHQDHEEDPMEEASTRAWLAAFQLRRRWVDVYFDATAVSPPTRGCRLRLDVEVPGASPIDDRRDAVLAVWFPATPQWPVTGSPVVIGSHRPSGIKAGIPPVARPVLEPDAAMPISENTDQSPFLTRLCSFLNVGCSETDAYPPTDEGFAPTPPGATAHCDEGAQRTDNPEQQSSHRHPWHSRVAPPSAAASSSSSAYKAVLKLYGTLTNLTQLLALRFGHGIKLYLNWQAYWSGRIRAALSPFTGLVHRQYMGHCHPALVWWHRQILYHAEAFARARRDTFRRKTGPLVWKAKVLRRRAAARSAAVAAWVSNGWRRLLALRHRNPAVAV